MKSRYERCKRINCRAFIRKGNVISREAYATRSSVKSEKLEIAEIISALGSLTGAKVNNTGDYPELQYEEDTEESS